MALPVAGEHAEFTRRLSQSAIDPLPALPLLPALQHNLAQAQAAHGEAFGAMMASLDPAILAQVQQAFGSS